MNEVVKMCNTMAHKLASRVKDGDCVMVLAGSLSDEHSLQDIMSEALAGAGKDVRVVRGLDAHRPEDWPRVTHILVDHSCPAMFVRPIGLTEWIGPWKLP
jgi:hypothetical protein